MEAPRVGQRQEKTQTETSAGTEKNYRLGKWERQTRSYEIPLSQRRFAPGEMRKERPMTVRCEVGWKPGGMVRVSFENDKPMTFP
jgi:hypothetical protein